MLLAVNANSLFTEPVMVGPNVFASSVLTSQG